MGRIADVHGRHPLAMGILTGTAVGACLGVLFAPRRGSETRKHLGEGVGRAKGAVGHWANRSHGAYAATRDRVVKSAKGTSQYVRGVAEAVTNKAREGDAALRKVSSSAPQGLTGQPRKAI